MSVAATFKRRRIGATSANPSEGHQMSPAHGNQVSSSEGIRASMAEGGHAQASTAEGAMEGMVGTGQ